MGHHVRLSEKAVRWQREAAGETSIARVLAASRPLCEHLQFWAILKINQSIGIKDDNIAGFPMYAVGYLRNAHFSLLFFSW